jgi:hypothetical protein
MIAIITVVEIEIEKATQKARNDEADIDLNPTVFLQASRISASWCSA